MKHAGVLFLLGFAAMAASWGAFVLGPQLQLGREQMGEVTGGVALYPQPRPGLAVRGAEVYQANGCYHCHTRQVQQEGTAADLVLTDAAAQLGELLFQRGERIGRSRAGFRLRVCGGRERTPDQDRCQTDCQGSHRVRSSGAGRSR